MASIQVRSAYNRLISWFSEAHPTPPDEALHGLPPAWALDIQQATQSLGCPTDYRDTIRQALTEAVERWQRHPDAANSLVVLGNPMENLEGIFHTCFQDWASPVEQVMHPISWSRRPNREYGIAQPIQAALVKRSTAAKAQGKSAVSDLDRRCTLVVIPQLHQGFLRCIRGWRGIEWLRDAVGQSGDYFWLIGCNTWAWAFLDRVCSIGAYFNPVISLPPLAAESLERWLQPLLLPAADDAAAPVIPDAYWSNLAGIGSSSAIALALWQKSLRVRAADLPDEQQERPGPRPPSVPLHLTTPVLPNLPSLSAAEHYLLQSLLLHGGMSRSQLVDSLGEAVGVVRSHIYALRRDGIIHQAQDWLSINPAHYPRLRSELSQNNFLVGDD